VSAGVAQQGVQLDSFGEVGVEQRSERPRGASGGGRGTGIAQLDDQAEMLRCSSSIPSTSSSPSGRPAAAG
jgi:hypothetical protein